MIPIDILITDGWLLFIGIALAILLLIIISDLIKIKKENALFKKNESELKLNSHQWALAELEKFKLLELDRFRKGIEETANQSAINSLGQWKTENEIRIRQDAINRSYSVNLGKISEHLVPFHMNFPFNPKDARFIGSPIDIIVFDGVADNKQDITIYFIEVKTGNSKLSDTQKKIKRAVEERHIIWQEINPGIL